MTGAQPVRNDQIEAFADRLALDRKSTRLNSSHLVISYAVFCLQKKTVPVIMPKPDVVALTCGPPPPPFMQVGSDLYCDSLLMCTVIDRLAPEPPPYTHAVAALA